MGKPEDPKDWLQKPSLPAPRTQETVTREAQEASLQAQLLDCPFCNHKPRLRMANWAGERHVIDCQCGVYMAFDGKTVDFLIRKWNTRGGVEQCA